MSTKERGKEDNTAKFDLLILHDKMKMFNQLTTLFDIRLRTAWSQYTCSMFAVPRCNSTVDWLYSCGLQEKHQITPRDGADHKYLQSNLLLKQI